MGDLRKDQYVVRRQALEQGRAHRPASRPPHRRAEALLDDFARLWEIENKPAERHKLLGQLFDRI